jgi:hypothetical protein
MMTRLSQRGWLFKFAIKVLKYFLLGLFGVGLFCLLSAAWGAVPLALHLIGFLKPWLFRALVLLACLLATVVVTELLRE